MDIGINKSELLGRILEMIHRQHGKIDAAGNGSHALADKVEGYLEALYQVEKLVLDWDMETGVNI
jgi:hypothetical protein